MISHNFDSETNRGTTCNCPNGPGEYAVMLSFKQSRDFIDHPTRYMWDGSKLVEWPGWADEEALGLRSKRLKEYLLAVDKEVQEADKQPFNFNGNLYYPDTEFIQGMFSILNELPEDYTEVWKTIDKLPDGVNNIYVTLDKQGIKGLALAYLQFKKDNWKAGEMKKQALKNAYLGS